MQLLREPLLHFILIGAAFFGVYFFMNRPGEIIAFTVSTEQIQQLETAFSNDWNRAPTPEELEILIRDYVREELAFREGMAMGLDRDDPVIRQRLRQKLEFMVEEQAARLSPSEAELEAFLREHADLFREEEGNVPELAQIRNLVIFEWENVQRLKLLEQAYAALYKKYDVQIGRGPE